MDTIYALSTAQGKAGVAIVRVSGPAAHDAVRALTGGVPEPRRAALRVLRNSDGVELDQALVLVFPEGQSFTGDPVAEFHLHGSVAVVSAVLEALSEMPGLIPADPGAFTRRALENGCLDLAQIEGLADLLDAETEAQRRQALRVLSGDLGERVETWRRDLIRAVALLEATIDFADEEVPEDVTPEVGALISSVRAAVETEIKSQKTAERLRSGFEVAIVGPPNIGKSTLLNALAGRDAAITSEHAGTTRDVIEVRMDLDGVPVTVLDTAGLRETDDVVEAIGIERAVERAASADIRVFLTDDQPLSIEPEPQDIVVVGKADTKEGFDYGISGLTGLGVADLLSRLSSFFQQQVSSVGLATRERHRVALVQGRTALESAERLLVAGTESADLAAEELHTAIRGLDSLIGRVDVENVLDEIFSSFCLGK